MKTIIKGIIIVVVSWLIMGAILAFNVNISGYGYRCFWVNPFTSQSTLGIG